MTTGLAMARKLQDGDDARIGELFDATLVNGRRLDRRPLAYHLYRDLCLGWYLGPGRDDAAVIDGPDGELLGYSLVCIDEAAAASWQRHAARRLAVAVVRQPTRIDRPTIRFYRHRLRDAVDLIGHRRDPAAPVHAHLNVSERARRGTVAKSLLEHVDERCRRASSASWYGEINEVSGRRRRSLDRLGLEVLRSEPNRTMSELTGSRIERLTIVRRLPEPSSPP